MLTPSDSDPLKNFMPTTMATITAEEAKEETFEDFKDEFLQKLNELRETNILCDTIIRAQGQDFPAHKCVLSAASPYFRATFTSELKEKESNLVELLDMKSSTISDLLRFIYTGGTRIDSSNAKRSGDDRRLFDHSKVKNESNPFPRRNIECF